MKKIILISLMSFATFSHASTNGNNLIEGYKAYVKATDETSDLSGGKCIKVLIFRALSVLLLMQPKIMHGARLLVKQ